MEFAYTFWDSANAITLEETVDIPVPLSFPREIFYNQTFFCTKCGRIWARINTPAATEYETTASDCGNHGPSKNSHRIPGSILYAIYTDKEFVSRFIARTLDYIPDAVVEREYQAHLNHFGDSNHE